MCAGPRQLFAELSPQPEKEEERDPKDQHRDSRRKAYISVRVCVIHAVMADQIPGQNREDGNAGHEEEGKEGTCQRKQHALEEAEAFQRKSEYGTGSGGMRGLHFLGCLSRLEYIWMASSAQVELWPAERVASQAMVGRAANGVRYAAWGETRIPEADLDRLVGTVPVSLSKALSQRAYYFVPLTVADTGQTMIAAAYSVELGDRAVCHRNALFGDTEVVFLSTRLMEDRFGLAFEFFINVAHNFVEAAGVPESFASLVWSQAEAQVRGETSQDAWETRRRATESHSGQKGIDERARNGFYESSFSDALAIYMLSLAVDFDYHDLRERDYPLLAAPALAERLRHVASLFPPNSGYEFQVHYRRKG